MGFGSCCGLGEDGRENKKAKGAEHESEFERGRNVTQRRIMSERLESGFYGQ